MPARRKNVDISRLKRSARKSKLCDCFSSSFLEVSRLGMQKISDHVQQYTTIFVAIVLFADLVCYLSLPDAWLFSFGSAYVWTYLLWHTDYLFDSVYLYNPQHLQNDGKYEPSSTSSSLASSKQPGSDGFQPIWHLCKSFTRHITRWVSIHVPASLYSTLLNKSFSSSAISPGSTSCLRGGLGLHQQQLSGSSPGNDTSPSSNSGTTTRHSSCTNDHNNHQTKQQHNGHAGKTLSLHNQHQHHQSTSSNHKLHSGGRVNNAVREDLSVKLEANCRKLRCELQSVNANIGQCRSQLTQLSSSIDSCQSEVGERRRQNAESHLDLSKLTDLVKSERDRRVELESALEDERASCQLLRDKIDQLIMIPAGEVSSNSTVNSSSPADVNNQSLTEVHSPSPTNHNPINDLPTCCQRRLDLEREQSRRWSSIDPPSSHLLTTPNDLDSTSMRTSSSRKTSSTSRPLQQPVSVARQSSSRQQQSHTTSNLLRHKLQSEHDQLDSQLRESNIKKQKLLTDYHSSFGEINGLMSTINDRNLQIEDLNWKILSIQRMFQQHQQSDYSSSSSGTLVPSSSSFDSTVGHNHWLDNLSGSRHFAAADNPIYEKLNSQSSLFDADPIQQQSLLPSLDDVFHSNDSNLGHHDFIGDNSTGGGLQRNHQQLTSVAASSNNSSRYSTPLAPSSSSTSVTLADKLRNSMAPIGTSKINNRQQSKQSIVGD